MTKQMALARRMAYKSESRFRLGAVLSHKKRIISTGFNRMDKTHSTMQKFNPDKSYAPGLHAEVHCSLGVPVSDLIGADIYIARVKKDGSLALAKPCSICMSFLASVGIRRAFYTTDLGVDCIEF